MLFANRIDNMRRQTAKCNRAIRCKRNGPCKRVLQFSDISRKGILAERVQGFVRELDRRSIAPEAAQEVLRKHLDVSLALAQRWQINRQHAQAVIEIRSKVSRLGEFTERHV